MGKIIKLPFNNNSVISVGWTGQNEYEEVTFDISVWLKKFPTGIVRVFYKLNTDGNLYPIADITSDTYIWKPQAADFPKPGRYSAQAIMESGTTIGKSDIFYFDIKKSLDHLNQISDDPPPEYPPSYIQKIMQDMEAYAKRAESAAEHIPYYEDGKLYVWDEDAQKFVEFSLDIGSEVEKYLEDHPIEVIETDPTVPQWAKNPTKPTYTASEVGALPADTPIPAEVTEQTVAGWGFTKNTGDYSKPSGGIPKNDFASDVQTSLAKADTALQQHQSLAAYRTSADQDMIDEAQNTAIAEKYTKPESGIPVNDLNSVDLRTWLDNVGAVIHTLSLSGTTVTLNNNFLAVVFSLFDSARQNLFIIPIGGTTQNPVVLILSLQKSDAQTYSITLGGEYNGNRYSTTLTAASANASPMTGTLTVEPIVKEPFEITITQNGQSYSYSATAAEIAANADNCVLIMGGVKHKPSYVEHGSTWTRIYWIDGTTTLTIYELSTNGTTTTLLASYDPVPDELPNVTASDNGKFLRVVSGAWAAQAVPSAESNSFGGGS